MMLGHLRTLNFGHAKRSRYSPNRQTLVGAD